MKGKDEIKDLFSDKLGNFEAPVRPDLWANIASQVASGTSVAASTGLSLLTKSIIGISIISAAVITAILIVIPKTDKESIVQTQVISEIGQNKTIEEESTNQIIIPELEKKVVNKDNNISPIKLDAPEIDQSQNFKSDISLIETLNEKSNTAIKEKNEEVAVNEPPTSPVIVNKEIVKQEKQPNSVIPEGKKVEEAKLEKLFTIGEFPNIFTPNGDGNNDFLFIESEGLIDFTIVVLDAKQQSIYESNDPNFKWNGVDKFGNMVSPGSYGYYIIARDRNGNKVNKFIPLEIRL